MKATLKAAIVCLALRGLISRRLAERLIARWGLGHA